jgi:hypothetical protein
MASFHLILRVETEDNDHVWSAEILDNFDIENPETQQYLIKELKSAIQRYPHKRAMFGKKGL